MRYVVTLSAGVDFAPADEVAEILQNVRTIVTTTLGEVPLDRLFGVPSTAVDLPVQVARAQFRADVIDAVTEYEPRATIRSVEFEESEGEALDGITKPRIIVSIGDDEEVDLL